MKKNVEGVFTSIITPFKKDSLKIDFDALMDQIGFISDHGCEGIIPLSTYGEFSALTIIEKKEILVSVMEARQELSVIPNVGTDNLEETLELSHYAQGIGADALVIMPPYFYNDIEPEGMANYFKLILNTIDIPVFFYNIPKYTGVEISDELIERLLDTGKLAGIKEASGDIGMVQHLRSKFPQLKIILGNDHLFYEGLQMGVTAFASYISNAFPEIVKAIDFDFNQPRKGGEVAQQFLNEVHSTLKRYPKISALKYAVTLRGLSDSAVRPPLTSLNENQKQELKNSLVKFTSNPILIH